MTFTVTSSWHVTDCFSSRNEWEDVPCLSFREAVDELFAQLTFVPDEPNLDNFDDEDFYYSTLNVGRGVYLCREGSPSFTGKADVGVLLPLT